jgi:hypothetical protein
LTACSLESRAGFVSHRQRSWDSPFGGFPSREAAPAFRPESNPRTVAPGSISAARRRQTGLTGPGFWVHTFRECLATARSVNPATAGASHGVRPSRVCHESLEPGLLRASSHTLCGFWRLLTELVGASECQSALAPPDPTPHRSACRPEQPSWGPCTCLFLSIRGHSVRAIEFTSHRVAHCCRLTDAP